MTCCIAKRDNIQKGFWIGADSQVTYGNNSFGFDTNKWSPFKYQKNKTGFVGFAGHLIVYQRIIQEIERNFPTKSMTCVGDFLDMVDCALEKSKKAESEGKSELEYQLLLIMNKKLYSVNGDRAVFECPDDYISIGAGQSFALGACTAGDLLGENIEDCIDLGLKSAIKYCLDCGGEAKIKFVKD